MIYFTWLSGKEPGENAGKGEVLSKINVEDNRQTLFLSRSERTNLLLLQVEPVGNVARLLIAARDDILSVSLPCASCYPELVPKLVVCCPLRKTLQYHLCSSVNVKKTYKSVHPR